MNNTELSLWADLTIIMTTIKTNIKVTKGSCRGPWPWPSDLDKIFHHFGFDSPSPHHLTFNHFTVEGMEADGREGHKEGSQEENHKIHSLLYSSSCLLHGNQRFLLPGLLRSVLASEGLGSGCLAHSALFQQIQFIS